MKGPDIKEPQENGTEGLPGGAACTSRRSSVVRGLKIVTVAILLATVAFAGGFGWFANHVGRLATPKNLETADAIIVLTGGQSRIGAAVDLLKAGKGQRLLISGVHPAADRDDLSAISGGDTTLFSCCVDIDYAALDTIGNAEESAKWVNTHAYRRVILVTNNYHMPRSLLEMRRFLQGADLLPYPVVNTRLDDGAWLARPDAVRVLFTEYTKYLAALVRGVIADGDTVSSLAVVNAGATAR